MEDLLWFLLFAFIVGINVLARTKKATASSSSPKPIPTIHRQVRSQQKAIRKKDFSYVEKKEYLDVLPQQKQPVKQVIKPQQIKIVPTQSVPLRDAIIWKEILDLPLALR